MARRPSRSSSGWDTVATKGAGRPSVRRDSSPCWENTASMFDAFIQWLLERFRDLGYPGIVVLMAIESSFLPLPSELVMPPAGYLAAKGEMSFVVAVACGVVGSILGALANYGLAHWLGRAFFLRLGKYVLITERALDRSERYFAAHGEISTFLGRMLPVVRHLISIPAGIARMHLGRFVVFTGLGALVWCTILTWIGWFIGSREDVILEVLNQEARRYAGRAALVVLPVLAGVGAIYILGDRRRGRPGGGGEGPAGWPAPSPGRARVRG